MAPRSYSVAVPAETCSLRALRAFFGAVLEDTEGGDADNTVLALDEACSNVIKYRCDTIDDGLIRVRAELGDGIMRFRIGRFCKPQDVDKIKPRDPADVRPGGLGTAFIAQIMDKVAFEADPDHPGSVALVLEKRIAQEHGS